MASKRSADSEPGMSSAAASARAKSPVTRKHRSAGIAENSETAPAVSSSPAGTPRMDPTFDEVAQLAYSYWEARGYQDGTPEEDWLRAEQELRSRMTSPVTH